MSNGNSTSFPSGKQRQKKSGRGLPTASFIASVITPVNKTEKRSPVATNENQSDSLNHEHTWIVSKIDKTMKDLVT